MKRYEGKIFKERFTDKLCTVLDVGNTFVVVQFIEGTTWPIELDRFNKNYEVIEDAKEVQQQ